MSFIDIASAALPAVGNLASAISQGVMNRKSRKWNEKMWHMQNAYNLPEAQMERFKAAGLNPNLIYGQGNAGNAGSAPAWNPDSMDFSQIGGAAGKYLSAKLQQGQLERQRTENAILATDLESKKIDVDVKKKLANVDRIVQIGDDAPQVVGSTNMLYEGALSDLQKKGYSRDREAIAAELDSKTKDANIDYSLSRALNEAARNGLIKADIANRITATQLLELEKVVKQYEAHFIESFNVKSGDVRELIVRSLPFILSKIFGK